MSEPLSDCVPYTFLRIRLNTCTSGTLCLGVSVGLSSYVSLRHILPPYLPRWIVGDGRGVPVVNLLIDVFFSLKNSCFLVHS